MNPFRGISMPARGGRAVKATATASIFFAVATVAMTWPLVTNLRHLVSDPGDPYLNTWILNWDWKAVFHDPLHLYDANIFFPHRLALAFSENMIGVAIFGFPLFFGGATSISVYNILFLLGMFLSGLGAWALAWEMTGDAAASLIAGIFYEFVPFRFAHLPHIQIQWGAFLPLALLFLWRFFRTRRTADIVGFAVFFAWNALANVYYGIFGGLAILLTCGVGLTQQNLWIARGVVVRILLALGVSLLIIAPFYAPYFVAARLYHFHRSLEGIAPFKAITFLSSGASNKLYGQVTARFDAPECQLFFGFLVPLLAVLALFQKTDGREPSQPESRPRTAPRWLDAAIVLLAALRLAFTFTGGYRIGSVLSVHDPTRLSFLISVLVVTRLCFAFPKLLRYRNVADFLRETRWHPAIPWALAMTALGILLTFGTSLFFYRGLYQLAPFAFGALRVPSRAIIITHLGLGTLAALGLSRLTYRRRPSFRSAALTTACFIGLYEFRAAPLSLFGVDATPRAVSRWLASHEFTGGVLELPMDFQDNIEYVYRVTEHGRSIINGYSGFFPADFDELMGTVRSTVDFRVLLPLLRRSGTHLLIFHPRRASAADLRRLSGVLRAGLEEGDLRPIALFQDAHDVSVVLELRQPGEVWARTLSVAPPSEGARILTILDNPPAFGVLDAPRNGQTTMESALRVSGWAAAEAGVERISIILDGRKAGEADYGIPREDVLRHFSELPCGASCGFSFTLRDISPGAHQLSVRIKEKNGRVCTLATVEVHVMS
jgi:hypothetical protein